MLEQVLYPTDSSEVSRKAVRYLKVLRGAGAKHVVLLRVINDITMPAIAKGVAL